MSENGIEGDPPETPDATWWVSSTFSFEEAIVQAIVDQMCTYASLGCEYNYKLFFLYFLCKCYLSKVTLNNFLP